LTVYLALRALEHESLGWALAAVALAGVGILVKQPAGGAAVGVFFGFALSGRWSRSRLLALGSVAALSTGLSAAILLVPEHSRFWTFELLLRHPIEEKLQAFFSDVHFAPHRVLLWALGVWGLTRWWRAGERAALTLLVAVGVTSALPSLVAYFKAMGAWNNLTVMDVWFALCAAPLLCRAAGDTTRFDAPEPAASRGADVLVGALLLVTLVPTRMAPTRDHYRYAQQLEALVHADLAAGRRVLVAHGAMFHIRAGHREPLLDRANSILELSYGDFAELADTRARLERHYYDRIYVNSYWYDASVTQVLSRAYRSDRGIPAVAPPFTEYRWGWQHLTPVVAVLSPRTRDASDPRARRAH
ncbi:MAG TPA: glycosyltransferase family 39 protein, partial [Polyangiaceae bacterium]|nr:glycosyltransferase family 39 protein [Polyangiaceae bacterium]